MDKNEIKVQCNILIDITKMKLEIWEEIYNITVNQNTIASCDRLDMDMIEQLSNEKKIKIENGNLIDIQFEKIYNKIKPFIDVKEETYVESLRNLKKIIEKAIDIKLKIQLLEEKNKQLLEKSIKLQKF